MSATPRTSARVPPHALEAEMSVVGGLMLDNRRFDDVVDLLREEDFYVESHRLIYRTIRRLASRNSPFDWVTVSEAMRDEIEGDRKTNPEGLNSLERVGGQGAVAQLTLDVPGASNVRAYAEIVQERSIQRALIGIGLDTVAIGTEPDGRKAGELIEEAEQKVFALRRRADTQRARPIPYSVLLERVHANIDRNAKSKSCTTGLRTGLADFDLKTAGLQPTDLILVAGRPSMGKSAFAGSVADFVAAQERKKTLVFSMEMSAEQWATRSVANRASVPLQNLRTGQLSPADAENLFRHDEELRGMPIEVDESGALSPLELRSKARQVAAKGDLGLIVVDYVQLMQIPGTRENRTNEVGEISRGLKSLAKELGVPVMVLSQLNRGLESRENKRPRMADLRDSGGLEQDADVIVFIYRDEVYHKDSKDKGKAELIIAKQRNGPTCTVKASFQGQFCRFADLAPEWEDPDAGGYREEPAMFSGFGGATGSGSLL